VEEGAHESFIFDTQADCQKGSQRKQTPGGNLRGFCTDILRITGKVSIEIAKKEWV
jgi:hypothetical protein